MMRVWEVQDAWGIDSLRMVDRPEPATLAENEVAIRMRAASINYRDLSILLGRNPIGSLPQVLLCDGSGEIAAVGDGVTEFDVGDRVCTNYFLDWVEGPPTLAMKARARGTAAVPGVLQDILVSDAKAVSLAPEGLSFIEAATLPCAALTAWHSLMEKAGIKAGDTVLVLGTGGVSIFALQFAKMAGAVVIATSSRTDKLERLAALGADHLINYQDTPEWGKEVGRLTNGGVNHIVEVGGAATISQSIIAAGANANILLMGTLGGRVQEITLSPIFVKGITIHGISVGSRRVFENMTSAIEQHKITPVVSDVFSFDNAPAAFRRMDAGEHFGKICIDYGS